MELRFNGFVLDAAGQRLLRQGREVALGRRAFDLLRYLVERPGLLITKEELLKTVWKAQVLSEGTLSNTIAKLRRALGQRAKEKYPIETIHGRGYRFKSEARRAREPAARASEAAALRKPAFVGRAGTLKLLLDRLACAGNGAENLVVLLGEAGIGKTRAAQELASQARAGSVRVWEGAAYEGGGAPPYWPWIQILRMARDQLSEEDWQGCMRCAGTALTPLIPELKPAHEGRAIAEPQAARFQLFEELSQLLKCASTLGPLLLVLEDLHCADLASVELLSYASHMLRHAPVTFLATLRTGEALTGTAPHVLPKLGGAATFVNLSGLSEDDVARLARAITGEHAIDAAAVRALHARTRGNPLFVCQILDLIAQRGEYALALDAARHGDLPPAIKLVLRRRFSGLPAATHRLLQAASVAGAVFDVPVVSEALQSSPDRVLDWLEPALRLGVVERSASEPGQFGFAHVLARDTLYEELGIRERGELHASIAEALLRREPPGRGFKLGEIAHHSLRAVPFDLARAVQACRKAASAARDASSFDDAARFLTRAIERLEREAGDLTTRFQLLLELGENHYYAGLISSAWNAFRGAVEAARECGRLDLLGAAAPHLVDCLELGVGDLHFARVAVEQALDEAADQAPAVRAGLMAQRAELASHLSREERGALIEQAAVLAGGSGQSGAILEVAHCRAVLRDPTCLFESRAAADDFLGKLREYPDAAASMRYRSLRRFGAHMTRYICALTSGDQTAAEVALEDCRHIAETSHIRSARLVVDLMLAGRALAHGRLDELKRLIPALDPRASTEIPSEARAWTAYTGALLEAQGALDVKTARQLAAGPVSELAPSRHGAYVSLGRARLFTAVGELERAHLELRAVSEAELARMPVRYGDLGALCSVVELYCARDERPAAARLYEQLRPHAQRNAVGPRFEYYGAVDHYLGLLARLLGREREARAHFEQALRFNQRLDMPWQLRRTQRELDMLAAR